MVFFHPFLFTSLYLVARPFGLQDGISEYLAGGVFYLTSPGVVYFTFQIYLITRTISNLETEHLDGRSDECGGSGHD